MSKNTIVCMFSGGMVNVETCAETQFDLDTASVDKAVCLAALHHVEDKLGFFRELRRCLVTGGSLLIADVMANTKEARFLNGFVNQWNSLGHDGDFMIAERDAELLKAAKFSSINLVKDYSWGFESEQQCHEFLRYLFALDKHPSKDFLTREINTLGAIKADSTFLLSWSLGFMVATTI